MPPGWDEFDSAVGGNPYSEYDYTLNENRHLVHYGDQPTDYGTDVYVEQGAAVHPRARRGKPFFAVPATSTRRTSPATPGAAGREPVPERPGAAHAELQRRPTSAASRRGSATLRRLDARGQVRGSTGSTAERIQSLQAVDRGVATLIAHAAAQRTSSTNTYFVFSVRQRLPPRPVPHARRARRPPTTPTSTCR